MDNTEWKKAHKPWSEIAQLIHDWDRLAAARKSNEGERDQRTLARIDRTQYQIFNSGECLSH